MVTRDQICDAVVEAQREHNRAKENYAAAKRAELIAAEVLRIVAEKLDQANLKLQERLKNDADAGKYAPLNPYAPFLKESSVTWCASEQPDVGFDVPGGGAT
jgi:hypothetical protein